MPRVPRSRRALPGAGPGRPAHRSREAMVESRTAGRGPPPAYSPQRPADRVALRPTLGQRSPSKVLASQRAPEGSRAARQRSLRLPTAGDGRCKPSTQTPHGARMHTQHPPPPGPGLRHPAHRHLGGRPELCWARGLPQTDSPCPQKTGLQEAGRHTQLASEALKKAEGEGWLWCSCHRGSVEAPRADKGQGELGQAGQEGAVEQRKQRVPRRRGKAVVPAGLAGGQRAHSGPLGARPGSPSFMGARLGGPVGLHAVRLASQGAGSQMLGWAPEVDIRGTGSQGSTPRGGDVSTPTLHSPLASR